MKATNFASWLLITTAIGAILPVLPRPTIIAATARTLRCEPSNIAHAFLTALRQKPFTFSCGNETGAESVTYLTNALRLESALLLLRHADKPHLKLLASAGPRAGELSHKFSRGMINLSGNTYSHQIHEVRGTRGALLVAKLDSAARNLGCLLLGPKTSGGAFVECEKRFLVAVLPLISMALEKSLLLEDARALNQRMAQAEEQERARIAADLHDGPLQKAALFTQDMGLSVQERASVARQLVTELREIGARLRPAVLDDLGLAAALDWLLTDTRRRFGVSTDLKLDGMIEDERFSPELELALFRIAQEATNNAVKHSGCSQLTVSLKRRGDGVSLTVADNGSGFDLARKASPGFGLRGMRERAVQLCGDVVINSTPGYGTAVVASLPGVFGPEFGVPDEAAHKNSSG